MTTVVDATICAPPCLEWTPWQPAKVIGTNAKRFIGLSILSSARAWSAALLCRAARHATRRLKHRRSRATTAG